MALSRRQKLMIILLLVYWPALFVLTHIPIPDVVRRAGVSDKALHFVVYLILAFLLWSAIKPHQKVNWRKAAAWWVVFVLSGYGVMDEVLQNYVAGRSCVLADFLANLAGVLASLVLLSVCGFWTAAVVITSGSIFALTNLTRVDPAELMPVANTVFHLFGYAFFAGLWIRYMDFLPLLRNPRAKWLAVALAAPVGLLLVAKVGSLIGGKSLGVRDIVVSVAGIAASVGIVFVGRLLRQNPVQA